jgi:phytoene synthase
MTALEQAGSAAEVVRTAARSHAPEAYLAALLAPRSRRHDLVALAAFAGETARIPQEVREPLLGEIRLQWWRDALTTLATGGSTGNPTADALGPLFGRHPPLRALCERMLEARAIELYDDPLPDAAALAAYLDATEGALAEAALGLAGYSGAVTAAETPQFARPAGRAIGLALLLARVPRDLARRRLLLPADSLLAAGLVPEEPTAPASLAAIITVSRALAGEARGELASTRAHPLWRERAARACLGPLAMVSPRLAAIERREFDPLRPAPEPTPLARVWYVWRMVRLGRAT